MQEPPESRTLHLLMVAFHEAIRQPEDGDQNLHDKQACRERSWLEGCQLCLRQINASATPYILKVEIAHLAF